MISRINANAEKALREAIGSVPHVEEDQILAPLAALEERERAEALGLAIVVTCYVLVDACGGQWPAQASVKRVAGALATGTTTAKRLHLDAEEIYAYLSRVVLGPEQMEDVIADEPAFTRLPLIVAGEALAVLSPKEMGMWEYLDRIESAIEVASALDASVLPAAVMRAYLPKAQSLRRGFAPRHLRVYSPHPVGEFRRVRRVYPHHRQVRTGRPCRCRADRSPGPGSLRPLVLPRWLSLVTSWHLFRLKLREASEARWRLAPQP
ncbi:MAG TPA: hypothetical protein VN969_38160 [Streptosporangiaceae bacterium]|nr:hypothetical protein [Streptosporangiaceae bacterium]